jgi:S-DNA-T family DNA segregation ATPase FtsK/SpoIIIE
MAKKKKKNKKSKKDQSKLQIKLKGDVKRGIASVFLFLMAVLFMFGFFGAGGALGNFFNKIGGIVFGWGKWLFPFSLTIAGIILLYRKKAAFYIVKILGLSIIFLSFLGFFHIFYEKEFFLEIAKAGSGGGYVGYLIAISLVKLTGKAAGFIVLLALLIVGTMVAFNFSILEFITRATEKSGKKDKEEESERGSKIDESNDEEKSFQLTSEKKEYEKNDLNNNIKEVKFVEGPGDWEKGEYGDTENTSAAVDASKKTKKKNLVSSNDKNVITRWDLPPLDLLEGSVGEAQSGNVEENIEIIEDTFANFGIDLEMGEVKVGPVVTQYSFRPAVGVKLSKIVSLSDDLALALAAHPIRIEAPIPGKSLIGIEVPNKKGVMVRLRNVLASDEFLSDENNLKIALGKDVEGNFVVGSLEKMPHLLIAGATGTGKSITINSLVLSLLYQYSPDDLKMILVDPKRVELSRFNKIPHLLADVIVDNNKVVNALKWAVGEMESRYKILEDVGSRDLESYHLKYNQGVKRKYMDPDTGEKVVEGLKKLPYIVIIIDELADLMASFGKDVEGVIMRLAQMSRAVGIHLVISTQRPSVEVLTGVIKANIPSRIALQVASQVDSRTILDMRGAEKLLGRGDMLFLSANSPKSKRIQSTFISEEEVGKVVSFIIKQYSKMQKNSDDSSEVDPDDITKAKMNDSQVASGQVDFSQSPEEDDSDVLYEEAKQIVMESKKASASLLQRRLRIGYNRAANLIENLENKGVVGPADGAKPREVLSADDSEVDENSQKKNKEDVNYEDDQKDQEQREKWQV